MDFEQYESMNQTGLTNDEFEEEGGVGPTVIAVVVMLSVFSVVGVVGNAVVFFIFFRRRNSSTSVIFILALAGTDFLTCLITIPYTIVIELLDYYLVYDLACKTYMFLVTSTVPFSAYIMVGIALDRYFCICHPFLYVVTIPRAKIIILCLSIPALMFGVMSSLMHGTYIYREKQLANITSWLNVSSGQQTHHQIIMDLYRTNPMSPGSTLESIYTVPSSSLDNINPAWATNYTMLRFVEHERKCARNNFIFSDYFISIYTKVHGASFVIAYVIVTILYVFIYKTIYTRRANKAKRKKKNLYPLLAVGGKSEDTQLSVSNGAQTTSLGTANNQQRGGRNPACPRKIVLTARNDAGVPAGKSQISAKSLKVNQDKDNMKCGMSKGECESTVNSELLNGHVKDITDAKTNSANTDKMQKDKDQATPESDQGMEPTHIHNDGDNGDKPKHDKEEEDDQSCLDDDQEYPHAGTPLMYLSKPGPHTTTSFMSSHSLVSLQSPSHSRNTLNLDTKQELEKLPPSTNHPQTGKHNKDNTRSTSSHAKDALNPSPHLSTSASVSPAVCPSNNVPIKITFSHVKCQDNKQHKGKHLQTDAQLNSIKRKRQTTLRNRNLVANIKTAFMLFVVTLVFLIAFLPALLMAHGILPHNSFVFYVYFIYNVANPFIYAFMNQTFREDLKRVVNVFCSR